MPAAGQPMLAKSPFLDRLQRQAGAPSATVLRRARVGLSDERYLGSRGAVARTKATTPLGLFRSPVTEELRALSEKLVGDVADFQHVVAADRAYMVQALGDDTDEIVKAAQQLLETGRKHVEPQERAAARTDLLHAYFLAAAAANRGNDQAAQTEDEALAALESLHAQRVESWQQQIPALSTKLDLVLRDMPVREALDVIGQACELKLQLIEGSVGDASQMLSGRNARISYLDVRGATAAQALDWMLHPLRLSWQPQREGTAGDTILVGSDRRLPGDSAWVYDVSAIALPSNAEFSGIDDASKALAKAGQEAGQFLDAVRKTLKASELQVAWFAPGQLLVVGNSETHRQAAQLVAQLSDPEAHVSGSLAALHQKTSERAQQRREQVQSVRELHRLAELVSVHDQFSWQLLAAALGGEVDDQALVELQIAWRAEETKDLLQGDAGLLLRSAWAITTAAKLLADQPELITLADAVRERCPAVAEKAVAALKDNPADVSTVLRAGYAALAMGDPDLSDRILASLPEDVPADSPAAGAVFAVRGILGDANPASGQQFSALVAAGAVSGEDVTVLVALACRRADGDAWTAFRAEMRDVLGKQPLPGSVVVLVNRLSGTAPQFARN
jgi:hypothetical protein